VPETNKINILLIGNGAREHALAWKISQSSLAGRITQWPAKTVQPSHESVNIPAASASTTELANFATTQKMDLVIVGPEAPLADGIADKLQELGIACFGPTSFCAKLETSKAVSKKWMEDAGVPTAEFWSFTCRDKAKKQAKEQFAQKGSVVVKASGLAAGKGVFVCDSEEKIDQAFFELSSRFGDASETIVVEEKLTGRESSYFCFVGNKNKKPIVVPLGFAVDFKRLYNHDLGPNTGGMGCYTPVPWLPKDAQSQVHNKVIDPILLHLSSLGHAYEGFLYVGLMWTAENQPKVIEFNCRLGDPEAQAMAASDQSDWLETIAALQELVETGKEKVQTQSKPVVNVVLTAQNYGLAPGQKKADLPEKPFPNNLGNVHTDGKLDVFFGGVQPNSSGGVVPSGGRVASLCFSGSDLASSRKGALDVANHIKSNYWPSVHFREDIGEKAHISLSDFLKSL